jgi:polyhydroxybutyrate depolymerase
VMIIHSAKDTLFPGFGAEAAAWWATCNQCERTPEMRMDKGCVTYPNCAGGVTTQYCEGTEPHARWPALNQPIIDFFTAAGRP